MICPACGGMWRANSSDADPNDAMMEDFCAHLTLCYGEHPHQLGECITWETAHRISGDGP